MKIFPKTFWSTQYPLLQFYLIFFLYILFILILFSISISGIFSLNPARSPSLHTNFVKNLELIFFYSFLNDKDNIWVAGLEGWTGGQLDR